VTLTQALLLALQWLAKHIVRRWYIYLTFYIIYTAPFPVVLLVVLGWLGFFTYRFLTHRKEKDTL
jgi:hypothetical protein